ncbi:MAG: hypothetical protein MAG451_01728 [Anaerolineales bacterium]|nr:hypothetical protein [Anaerolineales bacterium]
MRRIDTEFSRIYNEERMPPLKFTLKFSAWRGRRFRVNRKGGEARRQEPHRQ